ncbi:MAG: hypothetical protein HZY75_03550 [Nocardioidaceae bacterium]|nr:MAG: hypothetical protein HZY75_03550 [Nocardioidaceae bacterium]
MRISRSVIVATTILVAAATLTLIGPAQAARLITGADIKNGSVTGKDIKDDSLTGKDIKEGTLKAVPKAKGLAPLKPGKSLTGAFGGAGGTSTGGRFGEGITFQQPIQAAAADITVVDTNKNPDLSHCPAPGQAARGYMCLYFTYHSNVGTVYKAFMNAAGYPNDKVYGLSLYYPITGSGSYASGSWTVTAP